MSVYKAFPTNPPTPRHPYRRYVFFAVFAFFFTATLSFLITKNPEDTSATVAGFNPGNIINDYTMSNYKTMTEKEIQAFLKSKNPCNDTKLIKVDQNPKYTYHVENGHFVCMADELFGEGTVVGKGETAAHIIWQAAQDYKINPQVLIVLLEKEQSLITDTWPNDRQYRSATGYGCPDTAACDSRYYGLKNQIRNAAALFRLALDGKSSYYPVGNNYVLYNPNSSCGGSWVKIENLATGVLYRYTPYQPNAAALAAGTGTGNSCSSYGNRNFYHYFTSWFGSTQTQPFTAMGAPRVLALNKPAKYIDTSFGKETEIDIEPYTMFTRKTYVDGKLCLMTNEDAQNERCALYDNFKDYPTVKLAAMDSPRYLIASTYLDTSLGKTISIKKSEIKYFSYKITISGELFLAESATSTKLYSYSKLKEVTASKTSKMEIPRGLIVKNTNAINLAENTKHTISPDSNKLFVFTTKTYVNNELCLGDDKLLDKSSSDKWCIEYSKLQELPTATFSKMVVDREFYVPAGTVYYNPNSGVSYTAKTETVLHFVNRTTFLGRLCLQDKNSKNTCYFYDDLKEVSTFSKMDIPRTLEVAPDTKYVSTKWLNITDTATGKKYFTKKTYVEDELCLASDSDIERCLPYSKLSEQ